MATRNEGYKCEIIDSVFEDLYCKKCTLVARRLTIATCCGESFCQICVANIQKQGQPCPVCGKKDSTTFESIKNQKRINNLRVFCSMKERGCVWSGPLDQLDSHLDPHLDNCQFVDTKCPLNCIQTIPKNQVEQHVAQECSKRPHICQHCGFKATYEEVVDAHLTECKYVPLQCPNMCGVSCEREIMEDHMKICRLEEIVCDFSNVGCNDRFIREDQDEHARQNSQKHLNLAVSLAVETKQKLQQKSEQDNKNKEKQEKKRREHEKKIREQEMKLEEQDRKLSEQERRLEEQNRKSKEEEEKLKKNIEEQTMKIEEQHGKLWEQKKEINELTKSLQEVIAKVSHVSNQTILNWKFEVRHFSIEKKRSKNWKTQARYTHVCGYKFCIEVDTNMEFPARYFGLQLFSIPGEFDDQLNWPVKSKFTVEIPNQRGISPKAVTICTWNKPVVEYEACKWVLVINNSMLSEVLVNDTLYFHILNIELL